MIAQRIQRYVAVVCGTFAGNGIAHHDTVSVWGTLFWLVMAIGIAW